MIVKKLIAAGMRMAGMLACLVLVLGAASSQAACFGWFYQPEVPEGMDRFKK